MNLIYMCFYFIISAGHEHSHGGGDHDHEHDHKHADHDHDHLHDHQRDSHQQHLSGATTAIPMLVSELAKVINKSIAEHH